MERVHRLGIDEAQGETRAIFDTYQRERGNVPNMFRTMAHRPEILQTMIRHFRAVMEPGTVDGTPAPSSLAPPPRK